MAKDKSKKETTVQALHYEIEVPLYNQVILYFDDGVEFQKVIDASDLEVNLKGVGGYAIQAESEAGYRLFMMYVPADATAGVVAHECFHMTGMIMDTVGVKYDIDNDEPFAYLNGFMVEQVTALREHLAAEAKAKKAPARKKRTTTKKTPVRTKSKGKPRTTKTK